MSHLLWCVKLLTCQSKIQGIWTRHCSECFLERSRVWPSVPNSLCYQPWAKGKEVWVSKPFKVKYRVHYSQITRVCCWELTPTWTLPWLWKTLAQLWRTQAENPLHCGNSCLWWLRNLPVQLCLKYRSAPLPHPAQPFFCNCLLL